MFYSKWFYVLINIKQLVIQNMYSIIFSHILRIPRSTNRYAFLHNQSISKPRAQKHTVTIGTYNDK